MSQPSNYIVRVLLSSIRDGSECLCPGCCCRKIDAHGLGTLHDRKTRLRASRQNTHELRANIATARQIIYDDGYMVNSRVLDPFLKEGSYVATKVSCSMCFMSISKCEQNAFAYILSFANFNHFRMLVSDLMHKVEIGVWKGLFIHCLYTWYV
jgi:hypothetical protein